MSNYNYVNRVLIGEGANSSATVLPQITKGDLFLLDEKGNIITTTGAAAALPKFERVVVAAGIGPGIAILSSPIQGNTVSAYEGVSFRAPAEQVAYVGYNGTDGTLPFDPSTEYRLRIEILDDTKVHGQRQTLADYHFDGGASSTDEDAVVGILCQYEQKDYGVNYMGDKVLLEIVTDGATDVAYVTAEDPILTNGSAVVTFSSNVTIAAGSWVRFRGADYKVKTGVTAGTEITLENLYQGVSETIDVSVETTAVETLTGVGKYGFKITGLAQDALLSRAANEPFDQYEWILFKAYYSEADARSFDSIAPYTEAVTVDPGNGYWKQVAEREEAAKGYLGDTSKRRFDDNRIASNVVVDVEYDVVVISHADAHRGDFQGMYNAPLKTEIYIPQGTDQGDDTAGNNEFLAILNGFFFTKLGFGEIIF